MLIKSFIIFALLSFCTACFTFSYHPLTSLFCSSVLMLAAVLLLGSDTSSHELPHESDPCETDWMTEPPPEGKGALVFRTALLVPSPTPDVCRLEEEDSVHPVNTVPKLRRSVSFTMPKTNYWELDLLLSDDNDHSYWVAERSTVNFMTQLESAKGDCPAENLEKAPSLTAEQVGQLADAFIARFRKDMQLERQESDERAWKNLKKQQSYELRMYHSMLERSSG